MMYKYFIFIAIAISSFAISAAEQMQLRGKYAACDNNQKMNLWHISGNSPLIRDEMLQKDYCWRTVEGLHVDVIQIIGEFAKVQNSGGGAIYLAYRSDIEKIKAQPKSSSREIKSLRLISIKNVMSEYYQLKSKTFSAKNLMSGNYQAKSNNLVPAVRLKFGVDTGLNVEYEFVKEHIKVGFAEEQRDENYYERKNLKVSAFQKCLPDGADMIPSFYSVKIIELNEMAKKGVLHLSLKVDCLVGGKRSYSITDAKVELNGSNYVNFVRQLTDREKQIK